MQPAEPLQPQGRDIRFPLLSHVERYAATGLNHGAAQRGVTDGMITRRRYEPDIDWERLIALLAEAWTPAGPQSIWLRQLWDPVPLVWEDATGQLVGFADYNRDGEFEMLVAPSHLGSSIHQQMLADMEGELRTIAAARATVCQLATFAAGDDLASIGLLERNGFRRGRGRIRHMLLRLAGSIEDPVLPEGFRLRPVAGEAEIEARIGVNNAVWTGSLVTPERYRAVCGLSTYRQDLDLVAVAPDGSLAAFAIGWLDAKNRVGQLEPVGSHPDYRRLGLGKAIVQECLRRMQAHGAELAYVIPWGGSDATVPFYESCGFQTVREDISYLKDRSSIAETQER
jgi:GNAT superfamily N-acetyltransferase